MADTLGSLESGKKYTLRVPGLAYTLELPWVTLAVNGRRLDIVSLNLVGQIRFNHDLGRLLAQRIRAEIPDLAGIVLLTVVEKALQLTQAAAHDLGVDTVAVAYNRIKPHMEPDRRPVIQAGTDSVTSGGKFLAFYERDLNLLAHARRGIIIIDDVVSTGGTIYGLATLIEEAARWRKMPRIPQILGVFCVAREGREHPLLPVPLYSLTQLPAPQPRDT